MAAPIVYSWLDANAPDYFATAASFQALLTACLVTGYTGKAAAGWTKPFSDATSFVLKQGGTAALKQCIKFRNYNATATTPIVGFQVAEDYTGLSTPVNPWGGDVTNDYIGRGYATNTTTYQIPWIIIATARSVYFMFGYNTSNSSGLKPSTFDNTATSTSQATYHNFFGDYVTPYAGFTHNQMITSSNGTSFTTTNLCNALTSNSSTTYQQKYICSEGLNSVSPDYVYLNYLSKVGFAYTAPGTNTYTDGICKYPNPIDGGLYLDKIRLTSTNAYMGELPGALYSLGSQAFNKNGNFYTFAGTGAYTGATIYTLNGINGQIFIHDADWGVE